MAATTLAIVFATLVPLARSLRNRNRFLNTLQRRMMTATMTHEVDP